MRMPRPRSWVQWIRRGVQALFLVLFLALLLAARVGESPDASPLLQSFFYFDPLILLATLFAAHAVPAALLLSLVTIALTLLFGRAFCGWVCPLGTVHAMASWFRRRPTGRDVPRQRRSPWQKAKYYLLVMLLVMAACGVHWIGVFDPLSLLYRTVTTSLVGPVHYAAEAGPNAVYNADPTIGPFHLKSLTEPVYELGRDVVFATTRHAYKGSTLIFALFVLIVALNLYRPRFWCRYVCPLGGLLGLLSKRPLLRLRKAEGACNDCGRCNGVCPAAAQPDLTGSSGEPGEWLPSECYLCWNCVAACNFKGLSFKAETPLTAMNAGSVDLSRRATLAAGVGGVAGLVGFRSSPQAQMHRYNKALIRPPGARAEHEFLERCIQCGLCMKVCPMNGLQPATFEAGLEGVWTPVLVPKIGYCEYNCNLCGQVCPTGAIEELPIKGRQERTIGLAFFDTTRCLPYAYNRNCIICEEHCPVSPKAIYVVERELTGRDGVTRVLKQPRVDPDLCVGCGICEWSCVFRDQAAIRVTSANESRHEKNRPFLGDSDGGGDPYGDSSGSDDPYGSGDPYS
ncbi:MAG: 4Fe-4S binding protein [bacterium]|nr:4Fe-4S binding protein [bacterium]